MNYKLTQDGIFPFTEEEEIQREKDLLLIAEYRAIQILNEIRDLRNRLLLESDWTDLPNSPLSETKKQEWLDYRQELRDITLQSGFPDNIIWPVKPT